MNLTIKKKLNIFILALTFSTVSATANNIKPSLDIAEVDAKVKQLFILYNNHNEHSIYQQFTDTLGAQVDENEFLIDLKNKHNTLGNLIKTKLIFSHSAYTNLIYLFYQSTYERTTLTEYFILSRHHPMKGLQFNTDYVDTHGILKNDEILDDRTKKSIIYIQTLRGLYNNSNYYSYYKNMAPLTTEGILSKDDFISKMTIQKNKLGKYISSKVLFTKKIKSDIVIITYLTQYEKYSTIEFFGVGEDHKSEKLKIIVYSLNLKLTN